MNSDKKVLAIVIMVIVLLMVLVVLIFAKNSNKLFLEDDNIVSGEIEMNGKINIVTSLEDKITDNAAWCGTFNLIWNDLKNDLAKQDIIFAEQSDIVDNLNKGTFTIAQLNDGSYYKVYGAPTLELKKQIEEAIKQKFNEKSDILDSFYWSNHSDKDYFLYCMLKKVFEFPKVFTKLENGTFRSDEYENVKYFGINATTDKAVRNQVEVLYYNSEDDFAIKLHTKGNDEVMIAVGNNGKSFLEIYHSILNKQEAYKGSYTFMERDTLKIPYITFDLKQNITEVENKEFRFSNGEPYVISTALQTIKFELDEKGGKIKSEAGMMAKLTSIMPSDEPRHFNVDDSFTMFLIEEGKDLPYFATKISDISKVQTGVKNNVTDNTEKNNENKNLLSGETMSNTSNSEESYFYGTVVESEHNYIIVEPYESEMIRKSADKIFISLGEYNDALYMVGTDVKVTYTGEIMETYPAKVNVIDIEIEGKK